MNVLNSIRQLFSRPYPAPASLVEDVKGVIIGAIIVTFILYLFRPFGMSNYQGSILGISSLFGGVSLVAGLIYLIILRFFVTSMSYEAPYSYGKWVLEIIGMILFIAIGNWIVLVCMNQGAINVSSFLMSLMVTFLVGIFPVIIFGLQNQVKQERRNTAIAIDLATQLQRKEKEEAPQVNMILAIQAMENYINVYSLTGDEIQKEAIRRTLKSAQSDDMYQSLVKCHRSYLINPEAIKAVEGNAQGLKLNLGHKDCPIIPVSRSYIPAVKALLT